MTILTTTITAPRTLMAMSRSTLTPPLLTALITSANRHNWASADRIAELVELLRDPKYMRLLMYYALPTERERIATMHIYGLAGCTLAPHELAELLNRDPDTRVTETWLQRLQLLIREHLSVVFDVTPELLEMTTLDTLACLDLEDRTRLELYMLQIRRISQLTCLTIGEFRALNLPDFVLADVRVALNEKGKSFA